MRQFQLPSSIGFLFLVLILGTSLVVESHQTQADTTPPIMNYINGPNDWVTSGTTIQFSWMGSDPESGIKSYNYTLDGGSVLQTTSTSATISRPSDGSHTFSVRAINNEDLVGDYMDYNFNVDVTAPSVLNLKGPLGWANLDKVTFTWNGYDETSGIYKYIYKIDDDPAQLINNTSASMSFKIDSPVDGEHTFYVKAVDNANLVGSYASVIFKVDQTEPVIENLRGPIGWVNTDEVTFTWDGIDTTSGILDYVYQVDSGPSHILGNNSVSISLTIDAPADGVGHIFTVQAADVAGSFGPWMNIMFDVDLTPPIITTLQGPQGWVVNDTVVFTWQAMDEMSNVSHFVYRIDSGGEKVGTVPLTQNTPSEGTHQFSVKAVDNANNSGQYRDFSFKVDRTAPVIEQLDAPLEWVTSDNVLFTWRVNDDFGADQSSGIALAYYRIDSGPVHLGTSPLNISAPLDGIHTFSVHALDLAGNEGNDSTVTFKVDHTPPKFVNLTYPKGWVNTLLLQFKWEIEEATSGIDFVKCRIDNGVYHNVSVNWTVETSSDGEHTFQLICRDGAGLETIIELTIWTDITKPIIRTIEGPTGWVINDNATFTWLGVDETSGISHYLYRIDEMKEVFLENDSLNIETPSDGDHVLNIRPVDIAGNIGYNATWEFRSDLSHPVVERAQLDSGGLVSPSTDLRLEVWLHDSENGSRISSLKVKIDDLGWVAHPIDENLFKGTIVISIEIPNEPGNHRISLKGSDEAGNVGAEYLVDILYEQSDVDGPEIFDIRPGNDTATIDVRVVISASFSDEKRGSSGINSSSVYLSLDGMDVTSQAIITATGVSFIPQNDLGFGTHRVVLKVMDGSVNGNQAIKEWSFDVVEKKPGIVSLIIQPASIKMGINESLELVVIGYDTSGVEYRDLDITWEVMGDVGVLEGNRFTSHRPGRGAIIASYNSLKVEIPVTVKVDKEGGFSTSDDVIKVVFVSSGCLLVGLLAVALTEVGRYSMIALVIPLYARLMRKQVLDNKTRYSIQGVVLENPGIHYQGLIREIGLSNGAAVYHLQVLETEGYIRSVMDGRFKRFYSSTSRVPADRKPSPEQLKKDIIEIVVNKPGISQREISDELGTPRDIVGYHLREMVKNKTLSSTRRGKYTVYFSKKHF